MARKVIPDASVLLARVLTSTGQVSVSALARAMGCERSTLLHAIRDRKTEDHLPPEFGAAIAQAFHRQRVATLRDAATALRAAADQLDRDAANLLSP